MISPKIKGLLALAILSGLNPSVGEEPATIEESGVEQPMLHMVFSVFALEALPELPLYYSPSADIKAEAEILSFNRHQRAGAYSYRGPNPLILYRQAWDPAQQETIFVEAGRSLIPVGAEEVLLLFDRVSDPQSSRFRYAVHSLSIGADEFPAESVLLFNATRQPLLGAIQANKINLPPSTWNLVKLPDSGDEPVRVTLFSWTGNRWQRVLENRVRFYPKRRTLLLILPGTGKDARIRTRELTEILRSSDEGEGG